MNWWSVVWFRGFVPRQTFILWLVCERKLMTRDKLKLWGFIHDDRCVLCGDQML